MAREAYATRATSQEPNGALTVTPEESSAAFRFRVGLPPRLAGSHEPTTSDRRDHTSVRPLVEHAQHHGAVTAFERGSRLVPSIYQVSAFSRQRCQTPNTQHPTPWRKDAAVRDH